MLISNDILLEYLEIIEEKTNAFVAENIIMSRLSVENIELHDIYFYWSLIGHDKEDNKFCDLAVAGGADYLVTNDTHFNIVKPAAGRARSFAMNCCCWHGWASGWLWTAAWLPGPQMTLPL